MKKLLILTLALSTLCGCGLNTNNGKGEKVGQVVKLSKTGLIYKTWEGQLIRGGMSSGSGGFGVTPYDFTVEDDDMAKKVQECMENQTEVKIKYRIEGVYALSRSDSGGHFLVSIESVTNRVK